MKNNLTQVLICFIHELNVRVTGQSINEELKKHPDHPGLLEMNDVLIAFHITITVDHFFVFRNINSYAC